LESGDALESKLADLPLLLNGKDGENGGQKRFHGKRVDVVTDTESGLLGGGPDISAVGACLLET
jgi:hypothetical protein